MYRKNSNTWIYIAIGIAVCFILLLTLVQAVSQRKSVDGTETKEAIETETESETMLPRYGILIYKTLAGTVEFNEEWLVSETDSETALEVEAGSLVTLLITPADGKILNSVDVTDYDFQMVESDLRTVSGLAGDGTEPMRINFVMPSFDVIINFNYSDAEPESETLMDTMVESEPAKTETEALLNAPDTSGIDSETESITETGTEQADIEIIAEDASDASGDLGVSDTSGETYGTAAASDTGSTGADGTDSGGSDSGSTVSENSSSAGSGTGDTYSTTTSFDILSVSTVFLSYVTDENAFYQAAFNYVLGKGLTGEIIGTMSGYSIDPESKTATIKIMLNTGGTITGTYDKAGNSYAFFGL